MASRSHFRFHHSPPLSQGTSVRPNEDNNNMPTKNLRSRRRSRFRGIWVLVPAASLSKSVSTTMLEASSFGAQIPPATSLGATALTLNRYTHAETHSTNSHYHTNASGVSIPSIPTQLSQFRSRITASPNNFDFFRPSFTEHQAGDSDFVPARKT